MAELAVARTYGSALFEAARDLDKIELIKNEIAEMLEQEVIFLGDGVPVHRERLEQNPAFLFAPAHCNMQRASAVAALGAIMAEEGLAKPGNAFELIYLRKSQAEREREARLAKEEAGE